MKPLSPPSDFVDRLLRPWKIRATSHWLPGLPLASHTSLLTWMFLGQRIRGRAQAPPGTVPRLPLADIPTPPSLPQTRRLSGMMPGSHNLLSRHPSLRWAVTVVDPRTSPLHGILEVLTVAPRREAVLASITPRWTGQAFHSSIGTRHRANLPRVTTHQTWRKSSSRNLPKLRSLRTILARQSRLLC